MSSLKSILGRTIAKSLYYMFRVFPIKKNKIFVNNFFGRGYGDSPKYIIDYLLNKYPGFDVVWSVKDVYVFPQGIRPVKTCGLSGVVRTIYEQTTAKIWIDNNHKYPFERKRQGQYYIQTWHGDIPMKKIELDVVKTITPKYIDFLKHDSKMADLFVCGNEWMRNKYKEAFGYYGEVAVCGLPRRDILYNKGEKLKKEIKKRIGIDGNSKILLFVPTFRRDDIFKHHLGAYANGLDWGSTLKALEQRFGSRWIGMMRLHPNVAKNNSELKLPDNVIDVTLYPDISELLLVSDCCISDYSSALFDYAVTAKPGFIFAPDKAEYEDERGYYFSKNDYPFPVATTTDELLANIKDFDDEEYLRRHHHFYVDIVKMCLEGRGSEYIAKKIVEVCKR